MENIPQANGFTLIEVVVSIGIYTVLLLAISALFLALYRQQAADIGMLERTNAANGFLTRSGRELREANRAEDGGFTLAAAAGDALTFYSDLDGDEETERISYFLADGSLQKTVTEPGAAHDYANPGSTELICTGVANAAIFTYYNEAYAGSGASLPEPVRFLDVKLIGISLDLNAAGVSSYPLHFETKIRFRNL